MNTRVIQHTMSKEYHKEHLKQPQALYDLFAIELWERFAYYGMQILLVFFIADRLNLSTAKTVELNGAFMALVYASPTFGGYLADKHLGIKRTLILGAALLALGYFLLSIVAMASFENYFKDNNIYSYYLVCFYWSLSFIAIGNGCFKPNPTSLLSKVYDPGDPRIDAGYTIFYMSINMGALASMILTPILHANFGYSSAFIICSLGLVSGLIYFLTRLKHFKAVGCSADFSAISLQKIQVVFLTILSLTILTAYLLANILYANILISFTVIGVIIMFGYFIYTLPGDESNKVLAILILLFLTAIFFSLQLQMFGVLNLFIDKHVDRNIMGITIPTGNYAALNGLWIAIIGPLMAKFYLYFEKQNRPLSIPSRFAAGLLIGSLAFYLLSVSHHFTTNGMIGSWWIVVSYFIISLGEIMVSALGLALICKLAPSRLTTLFMGAFLLSIAIGGWISGQIGHWIDVPQGTADMQAMLLVYNNAFLKVGNMALLAGIGTVLIVPYLTRLTGENTKQC